MLFLPNEIWLTIFSYLSVFSLHNVRLVCKHWYSLLLKTLPPPCVDASPTRTHLQLSTAYARLLENGDYFYGDPKSKALRTKHYLLEPDTDLFQPSNYSVCGGMLAVQECNTFQIKRYFYEENSDVANPELYLQGSGGLCTPDPNTVIVSSSLHIEEASLDSITCTYEGSAADLTVHPNHPLLFFGASCRMDKVSAYRRLQPNAVSSSPMIMNNYSQFYPAGECLLLRTFVKLLKLDMTTMSPILTYDSVPFYSRIPGFMGDWEDSTVFLNDQFVFCIGSAHFTQWALNNPKPLCSVAADGIRLAVAAGEHLLFVAQTGGVYMYDTRELARTSLYIKGDVHSLDYRDGYLLAATNNDMYVQRI